MSKNRKELKNNNITKSKLQAFINNNYLKLGFSKEDKDKLLRYVRFKRCSKDKVRALYSQLVIKLNNNDLNVSKKGKHITSDEIIMIEALYNVNIANDIIAIILGRNRSSIGREITKGKVEKDDLNSTKSYRKFNCFKTIITYSASKANAVCLINKSKCKKEYKLLKSPALCEKVTKMIKGVEYDKTGVKIKYSPEAISTLLKQGKVKYISEYICATAIYNAAHSRLFDFKISDLPHGRAYYKKQNIHAKYKEHTRELKKEHSIENMPEQVKNKESITHFEGDSVIGKRAGRKNTLITLVNTSSKFLFILRSKNKTAKAFVDVLDKLEREIPEFKEIMQTLLLDNGGEFSDVEGIMRSAIESGQKRLEVYYAHPYTSCERGCNENKNRQIRKDFPKGKLVEELSDEDILNIARKINNTPRKSLGWKTALEVYEEQLKMLNIDTKFLDKYRIGKINLLVA